MHIYICIYIANLSVLKEISPEYSLEGRAEAEALVLWPPDAKS